ncbi:antitoxin EndoAI [Alicyclobacillus cellulosilyticus]|uniref:Antitoxin EndoAI n=1 Tax=Alicyclobacillus cellulosilyticus TaxID=1003997 RepID=A0A917K800_9BACL|nr:antitoxin EndoAI [Alicyclobacillus cellulosilyticus]
MSDTKRIVVYVPDQLLAQVDGIAKREQRNRSDIIREAMRAYLEEQRKCEIRASLQQGYLEMARINLRIATEAFPLEQEAGGTVERLVSGG